jgi:glutathione S-transferase
MNLRSHFPGYTVWSRAQADIERVLEIWTDCLGRYGGPWLFGERGMADAMYAPVVTRFKTYDVRMQDPDCRDYCLRVMDMPEMQEWIAAARQEPEQVDELEVEF